MIADATAFSSRSGGRATLPCDTRPLRDIRRAGLAVAQLVEKVDGGIDDRRRVASALACKPPELRPFVGFGLQPPVTLV